MKESDGWLIPAVYQDKLSEYSAVRDHGAGLIDLSARGRLLVSGSEAVQFLNGLITNDMKTLDENAWMMAALPNVQGRLIASVRVVRFEDGVADKANSFNFPAKALNPKANKNVGPTFMIDTEPATQEQVWKSLERFTFAGDFRVSNLTGHTAQLTVQGNKASEVVSAVLGKGAAELQVNGVSQIDWQQSEVLVMRSSLVAGEGFELIVNNNLAASLWQALIEAGAQTVGHEAFEILRIEAAVPRYGVDMDESNVVTETNLDDAVSYTKGCYIGQEIIARIKYRGHVARKLSGLIFETVVSVDSGSVIKSIDDKEIGRVTSVTNSPQLGCTIALGYLKFDYLTPNTSVKVLSHGQESRARVTVLPFLPGPPGEAAHG